LGFNETNGSILTSGEFTANGTDILNFYFNFVTSDGAGFPEYAWARLLNTADPTASILLFTARTCQTAACDTVPGVAMPPLGAGVTLIPATTGILPGTTWSPLGDYSGECWAVGCGHSGWINALYTPLAGTYQLEFGVVNVEDMLFDTGMAIAGAQIGNTPISSVPEPSTLLLLGLSLLGFVPIARKARSLV
jgi:hypothetical protein